MTDIYQFSALGINGESTPLSQYQGKVLLIVNTASGCGFTPQYKGLEQIYKQYQAQGFMVLGFPCNQFANQEKADEQEIATFCEVNFGVTFPLFSKINVNGESTHPLYAYLKQQAPGLFGSTNIKWNFTKFLVNKSGHVVKRFAPTTKPEAIKKDIEQLL